MSLSGSLWPLSLALATGPALVQNPLFESRGAPGEQLGQTVQALDDLDGDGLPEIGASFNTPTGSQVRVFRGADGSFLKEIQGTPIGDVNGDGLNDRMVGIAPNEIGIFSGDSGPQLWTSTLNLNGAAAASVEPFDLGDVDGDSKNDLLLNEVWWPPTSPIVFQLSVYSGADGSIIHREVIQSTSSGPFAAPVGDLDGDSITELAVVDDTTLRIVSPDGVELTSWPISSEVLNLGTISLITGGRKGADTDGDGLPELAFSPIYDLQVDAHTRVYSALTGLPIFDVEGRASALGGDFDADGNADLVVWNDAGLEAHSVASPALLRRVDPTTYGFPWSATSGLPLGQNVQPAFAAPIGDLDGDGLDELIVGESYPAASLSPAGRVRVFTGDASDEIGTRLTPPAALCPCGPPPPGAGCPGNAGPGASLAARGSTSIAEANLVLTGSGFPQFEDAILFAGTGTLANPTSFGAGIRLLGSPYRRVASHRTPPIGSSYLRFGDTHTFMSGPATAGQGNPFAFKLGFTAGQTYWLQVWYGDGGPNGPCPLGFNLTNAVQLTMTP